MGDDIFAGLQLNKPHRKHTPSITQIDSVLKRWVTKEEELSKKAEGTESARSSESTRQKKSPTPIFYAWGSDQYMQLGCGDGEDREVPYLIKGLPASLGVTKGPIKAVSAQNFLALAQSNLWSVVGPCWGWA
jgi:hypothetical protein